MMNITTLKGLFRYKPVTAWAVSAFVLAISVAYYETGTIDNVNLIAISFVVVLVIQGVLSHATNDLCDEQVDRDADIDGTGRSKVLISGIATREDLLILSIISIMIVSVFSMYVVNRLGYTMLPFICIGLYAAIGYNVRPLKLGWRPFSEITVVYPVLVTLVMAVYYMATGTITWLVFWIGTIHALMNIRWFIYGRLVDIDADDIHNKITTAVWARRRYDLCIKDIANLYELVIILGLSVLTFAYIPASVFALLVSIVYIVSCHGPIERHTPYNSSKLRDCGIVFAVMSAIVMSIWFIHQRLYIL